MKIIGISLGNNTSACVVSDKLGIEFAISEERLINEKNTKNFPINAILACYDYLTTNHEKELSRVISIAISSYEVINNRIFKYFPEEASAYTQLTDAFDAMKHYITDKIKEVYHDEVGIEFVIRTEHHEAHRLPAVLLSGFLDEPERLISITYDGFGDGTCATIYDHKNNQLLSSLGVEYSLALVYQFVTGGLGYTEHKHEGKITGLAGFGTPKYVDLFRAKLISFDRETESFKRNYSDAGTTQFMDLPNFNIFGYKSFLGLREATYALVDVLVHNGAKREDIAASLQKYVEQELYAWITAVLTRNNILFFNKFNIVLSGGFFANVTINYGIKNTFRPKNIFVYPAMGDEGTCVGAAVSGLINQVGMDNLNIRAFSKDVLYNGARGYGRDDSDELEYNSAKAYFESKVKETFPEDALPTYAVYHSFGSSYHPNDYKVINQVIIDQLEKSKVVCISIGDSEFGPRALGNHTILYDASHYETNAWLNKRLSRTEFMPFAPIVLDKFCRDLFLNSNGAEKTLKYMTIALPASHEFIRKYKAACHVDDTARPQILSAEDNEIMYELLTQYYIETGKKALVNTSFNLHNSPIIADDKIAIDSFLKADLDVLVLENIIFVKEEV